MDQNRRLWPDWLDGDELTGDFDNEPEATSLGDYGLSE